MDYGTSLEVIERLARDKERLRTALAAVLRGIALDVPRHYPSLKKWAEANTNAANVATRSEARACLDAIDVLRSTASDEGEITELTITFVDARP